MNSSCTLVLGKMAPIVRNLSPMSRLLYAKSMQSGCRLKGEGEKMMLCLFEIEEAKDLLVVLIKET